MRRLLKIETFVQLALLLAAARDALIDLCRFEPESDPNLALMLERLGQLNDAGGDPPAPAGQRGLGAGHRAQADRFGEYRA